MSKAIITSIRLWFFYLICEGLKPDEIRKSAPKESNLNNYFYISKTNAERDLAKIPSEKRGYYKKFIGKVGGKFIYGKVTRYQSEFWDNKTYECIREIYEPDDFDEYGEYGFYHIAANGDENEVCRRSCLSWNELRDYVGEGIKEFYAWHISNLVVYDEPLNLGEFYKVGYFDELSHLLSSQADYIGMGCYSNHEDEFNKMFDDLDDEYRIKRPPQSWQYVERKDGV